MLRPFLYLLAAFLLPLAVIAQSKPPPVKDPVIPSWVDVPEIDLAAAVRPDWAEYDAQVLLESVQYHHPSGSTYRHTAIRIQTAAGLRNAADHYASYDEETEQVSIHRFAIHRGGQVIDLLPSQAMRLVSNDGDNGVYTGAVTALLIPQDVRSGDIIEFAFTRTPLAGARPETYGATHWMAWNVPASNLELRILWPDGPFYHREQNGMPAPAVAKLRNGLMEYRWSVPEAEVQTGDDRLPSWFTYDLHVETSAYGTWEEVAETIGAYYDLDAPLPAELQELVKSVTAKHESPSDRARELLRYVQQNIRYVSLSLGDHNFRPYGPETTLERRFGDCKDKALMLSLLLREAGIDSWPALVSTWRREHIADTLPRPGAFDHVIVWADVAGGVFVDPTRTYARGPFEQSYVPPYGKVLPLSRATQGLIDLPARDYASTFTDVHEIYNVLEYGASLTVVTKYNGGEADRVRASYDGADPAEITRNFLNFYSHRFPTISAAQPVNISDDPAGNVVTLTESYNIERFFEPTDDYPNGLADLYSGIIEEYVSAPRARIRRHPLGITYPADVRYTIVLNTSGSSQEFYFNNESAEVENEAVRYTFDANWAPPHLTLSYRYKALLATLPADSVSAYARDIERISNTTGYSVTGPADTIADIGANGLALPLAGTQVFTLIMMCGVTGFWMHRTWVPPAPDEPVYPPEPYGIGGWLLLPVLGLFVSLILRVVTFKDFFPLFDAQVWWAIASPESANYRAWFPTLILAEAVFEVVLIILIMAAFVALFKKKRAFPWIMITLYSTTVIYLAVEILAESMFPDLVESGGPGYIGQICGQFIWIAYMLTSERVKNTFTR